ncbi:MAG: hypothetical protein V4726_01390 [Verrucomicrobiota bacterium]
MPRFTPSARAVAMLLLPALPLTVIQPAAASDWPLITAGYRHIEWIGGMGGESPDNGNEWNGAEGQSALTAELSEPHSATSDLQGNVYVADKNAHAIRRIGTDGILTTVAGTNAQGFTASGPATACQLNGPQHAYPVPDGSLYILDSGNKRVCKVDPDGQLTTVLTDSKELSRGLWVSRDGSLIYYATASELKRWTPAQGAGPGISIANGFGDCGNLDVAANGDIFVSDRGNSRIYRVSAGSTAGTPPLPVAGLGGDTNSGPKDSGKPALTLGLREARGVAFHPAGGYFVCTHFGGDIWYVDTLGVARILVEGDRNSTHEPLPQPVPTVDKVMAEPRSVTVALNGDLLIACNDAGYIRRIRWEPPVRPLPPAVNLVPDTAGLTVSWEMPANTWYCLESIDNLTTGSWKREQLGGSGSGGPLQFNVPAPARFVRLTTFAAWPN